jgi:hypothetical protein
MVLLEKHWIHRQTLPRGEANTDGARSSHASPPRYTAGSPAEDVVMNEEEPGPGKEELDRLAVSSAVVVVAAFLSGGLWMLLQWGWTP